MKRRNRMGQRRSASRNRKALGLLASHTQRKRKSWTFERLEDRLVFAVVPTDLQVVSFSSDNPAGAALTVADELNWMQAQAAMASGQSVDPTSAVKYLTMSLPNDPYFPNPSDPNQPYTQWNLLNIGQIVSQPDLQSLFGVAGQDLNVVPAWNMTDANGSPINGSGVKVAVIDTGVQLFHPDLAGNISPTLRFNSVNGTNAVNPILTDPDSFHGTAVAGIIGAVANNGIGGAGVAPGVTIVPIKADVGGGFSDLSLENALLYALQNNVDITNNSLGPPGRLAVPIDSTFLQILRDSVLYGRNGLGMINVYASGNDGAAGYFGQGFPSLGDWSSASYNPLVNSRYTIGVGAVDHDGLYNNADGTYTSYPESGPSVLVVAPTGSSVLGATNIGDDDGYGSGITTTDLVGDFGLNAAPLPNGFDPDRDFLPNPDYTSRMNGTSAAAPEVSGVIALMLQANPNLTYRDVEEILVRSSRQNAEFESPTTAALGTTIPAKVTWQTNQTGPFRNPDVHPNFGINPFYDGPINAHFDPIADPSLYPIFNIVGSNNNFLDEFAPDTNDLSRQFSSTYEPEPALFTNGAGYTVSQGYGTYGEQIGYAHGVIDAGAAVYMAKHWNELNQNIAPNTELTYTTSLVSLGATFRIPAAEKGAAPPSGDEILIPGGLGGISGFAPYWDQYFATTPFDNYTGKIDTDRGLSYVDFAVPPSQQMDVEWVEVKIDLSGAGATSEDGLNALRIMLVSPDGTQSELNNYYVPPSWAPDARQPSSTNANGWQIDPGVGLNGTGSTSFTWTFSTNRSWGENSSSEVLIHPATGEPVMQEVDTFDPNTFQFTTGMEPIFRNWELHVENYSPSTFNLDGVEVVWHGKPIGGGTYDPNYQDNGILSAQRVQGFVGIDTNGDNQFNFNRYVQTLSGQHADVSDIRTDDIQRTLDYNDNNHNGIYDEGDTINQEPFAANVVVDAYKVWNGVPEAAPTARFLTGADGNYYFDLDPVGDLAQTKNPASPHFGQTIEYQIRASDPLDPNAIFLDDTVTPGLQTTDPNFTYLPHYASTWTINPNWFFAADHDNPTPLGDNPGEIFFDSSGNAGNVQGLLNPSDLPEPGLPSPVAFNNNATLDHIVPAPVKNINFLLKATTPANEFDVTGTVYSDVNGDGKFNGSDAAASDVSVYWDKNRNGVQDPGELTVLTDANGQYTLPIDLTTLFPVPTQNAPYQIGVVKPTSDWTFIKPDNGVVTVFAGPGSPTQTANFFIKPPGSTNPNGNGPGTIQGVVFNDLNGNGTQEVGETGVANFRVFIDTDQSGTWDSATEVSTLTGSNGSYFFNNVQPGVYRIDIVIPNEGTPAANWAITKPTVGYRDVQLVAGGSLTGVNFGLANLADGDWGDLPDSYHTTSASNGPSHKVVPGFQLGATLDGEVNGVPSANASSDADDDGVKVVSNGGVLKKGVNTLEITVMGVGGLLTGWMDFNNDGHFDESERLTWTLNGTNLGGEADLNPGTYDLQITIPAAAVDGRPIASRFRWGEEGLSFDGPAQIGEVEDYFFGLNYLAGDYNRNGVVDQGDFLIWSKQKGQNVTPYSGADGNGDGVVNQADFDIWKAHFGEMLPPPGAGAIVAFSSDTASADLSSESAAALAADYGALAELASGSSSGPSYVVLGPSAPVPTSQPVVAVAMDQPTDAVSSNTTPSVSSDSSLTSAPQFAAFVTDFGQSAITVSTVASVDQTSTANTAVSNSDLLLLDQTWADLDHGSYDHADESLYNDQTPETVSTNDLALAAVLNEDDNQWNSI